MQSTEHEQLSIILNRLLPLEQEEWQLLADSFERINVPAKTVLTEEGSKAQEIFYISQGILRLYYNTRDNEQVTAFLFSENMFASSLESFLLQAPSNQVLETLEPCTLLVITKERLENLYQNVPKTHILMRKVMEHRFVMAQQLLSSYILASPQERYQQFAAKNPDLLQRVPQHIIASFLGVTPVSLSRIRKRLTRLD